jgi:hypothetical protein
MVYSVHAKAYIRDKIKFGGRERLTGLNREYTSLNLTCEGHPQNQMSVKSNHPS